MIYGKFIILKNNTKEDIYILKNNKLIYKNKIYTYEYNDGLLLFDNNIYVNKNNEYIDNNNNTIIKKDLFDSNIIVKYSGRVGNNMFQYAYSRLFSEKNNFRNPNTPCILNKYINTKSYNTNTKSYDDMIEINDESNYILDEKVYNNKIYYFNGYFQKSFYYKNYKLKIKEMFKFNYPDNIIEDDIVISVRLGDYKFWQGGTVISPNWYLKILENEKFDKLHIVTDEPENIEYFKNFNKYKYIIYHNKDLFQDMMYLMKFSRLICSNSTYAWWAAFLGNFKYVYMFKKWVRIPKVDLLDIDNSITVDGDFY